MRVWVGSPGTFSTRKCRSASAAICGRCVIVITCARSREPLQDAADGVRGLAADAGVDLVEDERLAARDRRRSRARCGESSPPEAVSATGANGRPGVRADEEDRLVAAGRAGLRARAARTRTRRRPCRRRAARPRPRRRTRRAAALRSARSSAASSPCALSAAASAARGRVRGIDAVRRAPRARRALPRRARAAPRRSGSGSGASPRRSGRASPRAPRAVPGSASSDARNACSSDAVSRRRSSTSRSSSPARFSSGASASSGATARSATRDEPRRAFALVGRERLGGCGGRLRELGDVPEPLALGAQRVLRAGLEPLGVLDERAQLGEARLARTRRSRSAPRAACARAASSRQAARASARGRLPGRTGRAPRAGTTAARAAAARTAPTSRPRPRPRRRRPRAPPRAPRRTRACGRRRRRGARRAARPRPPGRSSSSASGVELGLDVRLGAGGPDEAVVALRAEQQADRLREDRLARAGLAGDRVQAGRELELRLPDQHEVLDAEPAQHQDRREADGERPSGRERLAVAAEERRLRQGREQAPLPRRGRRRARRPGASSADVVAVDEQRARRRRPSRSGSSPSSPRGTTSGRACSECGAMNVTAIASRPAHEHRPAVREVVRGRARRRRADHPVARDGRRDPRRRPPTRARPSGRASSSSRRRR